MWHLKPGGEQQETVSFLGASPAGLRLNTASVTKPPAGEILFPAAKCDAPGFFFYHVRVCGGGNYTCQLFHTPLLLSHPVKLNPAPGSVIPGRAAPRRALPPAS